MKIYHCKLCGQTVEAHIEGVVTDVLTSQNKDAGTLTCCNQAMEEVEEKSGAEGLEKHKPVLERTEKGINVKVGSIEHPMGEEHFIGFIQIIDGDKVTTKILEHTAKPEANFEGTYSENAYAREFCNLHGLWRN